MFVLPLSLPPIERLTLPLTLPPPLSQAKSVLCLHLLSQSCYFGWERLWFGLMELCFHLILILSSPVGGGWWSGPVVTREVYGGVTHFCGHSPQLFSTIRDVWTNWVSRGHPLPSLWSLFFYVSQKGRSVSGRCTLKVENHVIKDEEALKCLSIVCSMFFYVVTYIRVM